MRHLCTSHSRVDQRINNKEMRRRERDQRSEEVSKNDRESGSSVALDRLVPNN